MVLLQSLLRRRFGPVGKGDPARPEAVGELVQQDVAQVEDACADHHGRARRGV